MTRENQLPRPEKDWGYDKPAEPTTLSLLEVAVALKRYGVVLGAVVQARLLSGKVLTGTVEEITIEEDLMTLKWLDASRSTWSLRFALDCMENYRDVRLQVIRPLEE